MKKNKRTYWNNILGVPRYKIDWYLKYYLYKIFGFKFNKLKDQRYYWNTRGAEYYNEVFNSHHYDYEKFFQDMLINQLKKMDYTSFFEAGCGFGWNVKRVKEEFPNVTITGLDFSIPQLCNSRNYNPDISMPAVCGDACNMPFKDDAFDVGFTLGVYMNVHPNKIDKAIDEMIRVTGKYIIHIEWDQENTTRKLREKRAFKTNIVSHDYKYLYKTRAKEIVKFETYNDFGDMFYDRFKTTEVLSWEQFEGAEKYILIVIQL